MVGGAGRRNLPTATLLGLLALLAGPVAAASGDGLSIENQLYITAGLLGGLAFVLTIAVVYLLLTLNRVQNDVFKLKDAVSAQKQPQQPPTTKRADDEKDSEDRPPQIQSQQVSQSPPASQQQSQPISQMQSQPLSQQQWKNTTQQQAQPISQSQPQTVFMPQSQQMPQSQPMPQSLPDPLHQSNDARKRSYLQQSSYQPATSQDYTSPLHRQQYYGGAPQRPVSAVPLGALRREPSYDGAPVAAYGFPAQAPQRGPTSPDPYVRSASVYPRDRY